MALVLTSFGFSSSLDFGLGPVPGICISKVKPDSYFKASTASLSGSETLLEEVVLTAYFGISAFAGV